MSFSDEYNALKKKRKKPTEKKSENKSFSDQYSELKQERQTVSTPRVREPVFNSIGFTKNPTEDIAPVGSFGGNRTSGKLGGEERKWFQKGAFEDGYQFGDVTKTILGSVDDVGENLLSGVLGMGEKIVDSAAQLGAWSYGGLTPNKYGGYDYSPEDRVKAKQEAAEFVKKDLYNEEKIAKKIMGVSKAHHTMIGIDAERDSVFGEKSDSLVQSAGQLAATAGLNAVGVPWFVTTGITTYGGELENAYNQGATYKEAGVSAAISAGAEILTERIGGISFGGKTLGDSLTKNIARGVSSKVVRTLTKLGIDAAGEGFEEILSGTMGAIGQKITYADDKELTELFSSEEALESFIGGAVLGGMSGVGGVVQSKAQGVDAVTGLTANEQKVVDKVYKDAIAEQEQDGKKLTAKEKSKLYDDVLNQMERGYISTDTIEEVLGGETYRDYKNTVDYEDALLNEYEELGNRQNATLAEQARYTELLQKKKDLESKSQREALRMQLGSEVSELVKGDRLIESYNERGRRSQAFEADLTQYDSKQQAVIQKAVDSGILNNTNRTHEFVDMVAKISADKGVLFDFTNNQRLKDSGFAVDGKSVNGYVTKDGVTLNIDSGKSLNSVVGHEITHVLEGTELYDALSQTVIEYAKSKGDYQGRYDSLSKLYEGVDGANVDAELTADLVGDYLFTDADFVRNLSVQNRNVFQKIYDEIKYLVKVATAGSKEARELEKVKRAFDKAYQESGKVSNDTKYSLTDNSGKTLTKEQQEYFKDSKVRDENGNLRVVYHSTGADFTVFDINRSGQNYEGNSQYGRGMYFAGGENGAIEWGGYSNVVKAYLYIKNPLYADKPTPEDLLVDLPKGLNGWSRNWAAKRGEYLINALNSKGIDSTEFLQQHGYDGIIDEEATINYGGLSADDKHQYVVFSPEQIKRTDNTSPTSDPDIRYSLSDSEGRHLSKGQSEYFKDSKATDENGSLKVVYHGTRNADFTVFNRNITYFTDSKEMADSYSPNGDMYEGYVNITKPYEIDAKGEKWSRIPIDESMRKFLQEAGSSVFREGGKWRTTPADIAAAIEEAVDNGDMDYDGIIIKNVDDTGSYFKGEGSHVATDYIVFNKNQFKNIDNQNPTADHDIRFSLSEPMEQTKDLMALHNLRAEELLKSLDLGGLPMPSVAIIKATDRHEQYGDVSLILPKETIDPKASAANKVYGGDAWTPTYPRIEYKAREKSEQRIRDKYYELSEKIGNREVRPMYQYMSELENMLNRAGGEAAMLEELYEDTDMMNVYLQDSGKGKVQPIIKEIVTEISEAQVELNQFFIDALGEDVISDFNAPEGAKIGFHRRAFMEKHGDEIRAAYKRYFMELHNFTEAEANDSLESISNADLMVIVRNAYQYTQNKGVTVREETDLPATREAIRNAASNGYKEWVDSLFKGVEEKSGIRNNKDYYTSSGNPRSWNALHWENTLENVIKVMKGQDDTGTDSFNPFNNLFSKAHKRYGSIAEIKADSSRLGKISEDEYEALKDSFSSRFVKIADSIKDPAERNPFIATDNAAELIVDAVRTQKTKSGMLSYLQKWNKRVTTQTVEDVVSLVNDIANMPTGYFEAKPQRAVGFDEVGVFVIPNNADVKLKQELLNRGYAIAEYDPNIEGHRQQVVNQFEEYKFSLSNVGETPKPYGNFNVYGKDIMKQEAPVQETVAGNATVEEIATMTEEEAFQMDRLESLTDADAPPPRSRGKLFDIPEEQKMTVEGRRAAKLKAVQTELAADRTNRLNALADYNQEIARLQAQYDAKKNKNTKVANDLLRRIERTKRLRDSVDADYAKRITDLETREKLIREGKPTSRQELHNGIMGGIKDEFGKRGYDLDKVLKRAKNLHTFATVDNTPQRVMEKALGYKEGQILSDITVNQVAQNESDGIVWLNSFTNRKDGLLAQLSKQYHIKPGSKESAAAQMYAEGFYVNDTNDIISYGDAELAKDFPDAQVQANIKGLASDPRIRRIYDETLAAINESRTRNAYPEIPRLDNYFLHFRAMDDTFSKLGLPFNPNDIRAKDLPTDLNGVTADLKPGQPYFASAMHRTGKRTSFDLLGGLERYLTSAKNQIYHIDDIQTLRALRNYIADTYGQANGLEGLDALSEEEAQDRIEKVYNSHLSTFAKFLNEEANILAGKTALIDRGLEGILGRRGMTFLDTVNKQVGANMVGFNVSSSLTNFLSVAQAFAKTNKADFVKAFGQTVANKVSGRGDAFAEQSPVMIRRKGADRFYRTPWQKAGDAGYVLMSAVDNISTELIARTKYNELTRKGMDSRQAHYETDKWVSRLMGDRSLGQMPQLYNSKMLGLITKFQLEVRNQLDSMFYDTIQEAKVSNEDIENGLARNAKTAAKVASTFVQLAVVQHLFGKAFESVAGYNPAFDIIEVLLTACGFDDDEDSEDTVLDNIEQGFLALLEDLPYTSTFTGGRIPISNALPIKELVTGTDERGNEKSRLETLGEIAPYYVLPGGYGQIKKTVQGLSMFSDDHPIAGSYTDSGSLRFPVEDTLANRVQAGIFGQWANKNARTYFDNDLAPLDEKRIQEYSSLGLSYDEYWTYRHDMKAISKRAEAEGATDEDIVKSKYISSVDSKLSEIRSAKLEVLDDATLTAKEKEARIRELDQQFDDLANERYNSYNEVSIDGDYAHIGSYYYQWYTPEDGESYWRKLTEAQTTKYLVTSAAGDAHYATDGTVHYRRDEDGEWTKISDKQLARQNEVTKALGITPEEYWSETEISFMPLSNGEYEYAYENPENYAVAKVVGGYDAYKGYKDAINNISADKDENGNSISGSKKEKVAEYINGLDLDYGEKIILYRSMYSSKEDKNSYNLEIIEYLDSRSDISYEEMVEILEALDMKVTGNTVTW